MQLIFDSLNELNDMLAAMGYVKGAAPAGKVTKAPTKKKATPAAAAEAAKAKETFVRENETSPEKQDVEVKEAPEVTLTPINATDILTFVKANFSDNIQPVKDMLSGVGAKKISEIPEDKMSTALEMLHQAVAVA